MTDTPDIKPTDLRGILKYVPRWRGHTFVVSLDGSIVEHENIGNLILDLAVLASLNMRLVVAHGIGRQLRRLADQDGVTLSDQHGSGPTDQPTLDLAVKAAGQASHELMQRLTHTGLRCAVPNAVRATQVGVLAGKDQLLTGKVDKIDLVMLRSLLDDGIVPVVSPVGFDRSGRSLRINSDHLAAELAMGLEASKLIYLMAHPGLTVQGAFKMNVPVEEVQALLEHTPNSIDEQARSKARYAVRAIEGNVPRAHILDGRLPDGLLTELFSSVGIGTMIHGNEYQQIRPAALDDAQTIDNITRNAVKSEMLTARTLESIERHIGEYFVYEIDGSVLAVVRLREYPDRQVAEIASVYVQPFYAGRGAGQRLVDYAIQEAAKRGYPRVFALTTQTLGFFESSGFDEGAIEDLPPVRARELEESGRNSKIYVRLTALDRGAPG